MIPGMGGMEMLVIAVLAAGGVEFRTEGSAHAAEAPGEVHRQGPQHGASSAPVFDEMARQSELRKEVEALRNQQAQPLGPELETYLRDIGAGPEQPADRLDQADRPGAAGGDAGQAEARAQEEVG